MHILNNLLLATYQLTKGMYWIAWSDGQLVSVLLSHYHNYGSYMSSLSEYRSSSSAMVLLTN